MGKLVCLSGVGCYGLLTAGKEYEILRSVRGSYIVKRDDDSVDKIDKSRFGTKKEYETLCKKREEFKIQLHNKLKNGWEEQQY